MEKISDFRYKELDQKQIPAEEEERPNVKYFKQKVIGNVVKVTLSDGRQYVGRLQCVDHKLNIFIQHSSLIIKKQHNPMYYQHAHFASLQNKLPQSTEELEYAGSIIVGKEWITKLEVDHALGKRVEAEVKKQKELWIEKQKARMGSNY